MAARGLNIAMIDRDADRLAEAHADLSPASGRVIAETWDDTDADVMQAPATG